MIEFIKQQNRYKNRINLMIKILCVFLFVFSFSVNAQDFWIHANGPEGGSVQALAVTPGGQILAGTDGGGIFRSTNDGNDWNHAGLLNVDVQSFAVDTINGYVFAGTAEGVFRSDDNGNNWSDFNNGLNNLDASCMAAGSNNHIFVGTYGGGMFRSDDFGNNWTAINNNLTNQLILSLSVNSSGHIFAGTDGEGVFRSVDNGDSWLRITSGMPESEVTALTIKSMNDFIFAATHNGIFRSTNNGDTWNTINNGLNAMDVISIAVNQNGQIIAGTYEGIYRSDNDGDNWTIINNGLTNMIVKSFAIKDATLMFAGTLGGVYRSADLGDNWGQINSGLHASIISSLISNRFGDTFAGTEGGGLFRSTDAGASWIQLTNGLLNPFILSLSINSNGDIFAGTYDGVFRSTNNGDNWMQINTNLSSSDVYTLAINSIDHIFAGTYDGVFRSTNNGDSWQRINSGLTILDVNALLINSNDVVFAACDTGGFFKSVNNGDTWTLQTNGLTNTDILSLTKNSNDIIFIGSYEGVYRSTNNGDNWIFVNNGLTNTDIFSLQTDFVDRVYAGSYDGVFVSNNNGDAWNQINTGLTNIDIFALCLHPAGYIFSGSYGGSAFRSQINTSLAPPALMSPTDLTVDLSLNPTLSWRSVMGASTYDLEVASDINFTNIVFNPTGISDTFASTSLLEMGTNYFWRVNAHDIVNTSFWSEVWSFTTLALPVLTIQNATGISDVSAILNGEVNPNDHNIVVGFEYGEDNSYGNFVIATPDTFNGTVNQFVYADVSGLHTDWDYHFRIVVDQVEGAFSVYGIDQIFHTQSYPTNIDLSANIQFPSYDNPSDYGAAEYRLFGLPGRKDSQLDIANILSGDHKITWQAYWDNGTYSDNHNDYLIEFDGSGNFRLGDGNAVWLLNKGNLNINISGIQTMPTDGDDNVRIPLHNGWNLITCPFVRSVPWWAIQQINSIANPVYEFNGGWNTSDFLNPYQGYIFDNVNNLSELIVPYRATLPKQIIKNDYDWRIKIALKSNEFFDNSSYLGVSENSEIGLDQSDFKKPHAVGSVPSVYFDKSELDNNYSSYATDIRPPINEFEKWEFQVSANPGINVNLKFTEVESVPSNFAVVLVDRVNSKCLDLRKDNTYQFIPVTATTKFEILVGYQEYIQEEIGSILPLEFSLGENFPNPFNPSTTIPVSIPEESELTLKVYNVLGQEIKTIFDGPKNVGRHYFKWDGTNYLNQQVAAGIYLYRLNTDKGYNFVGKMVLVK
jgi:photosystem II stability/assembly factor-like uncharacterized protein